MHRDRIVAWQGVQVTSNIFLPVLCKFLFIIIVISPPLGPSKRCVNLHDFRLAQSYPALDDGRPERQRIARAKMRGLNGWPGGCGWMSAPLHHSFACGQTGYRPEIIANNPNK